jgi:hypothetical protein
MQTKVVYICEICGEEYGTIDGCAKCEAIGKPTPKYRVGDIVTIATGEGAGKLATVSHVMWYPPSWGGNKYTHKVGYHADIINDWGSRQLIEGESVI